MAPIKTDGEALAARGIAPDGRALRAIRTRQRIIATMAALLREGNPLPTVTQIGARAGISTRSVFMHFGDTTELFLAVLSTAFTEARTHMHPVPNAPFENRLAFFVDTRIAALERFGAMWRLAGTHFAADRDVQQQIALIRDTMRARVHAMFATEFVPMGTERAGPLVDMLLAATALDVWTSLRTAHCDRLDQARAAMRTIVRGIFLAAGSSPERRPVDAAAMSLAAFAAAPSDQP
jgi:AcrR family transcriptional regulator